MFVAIFPIFPVNCDVSCFLNLIKVHLNNLWTAIAHSVFVSCCPAACIQPWRGRHALLTRDQQCLRACSHNFVRLIWYCTSCKTFTQLFCITCFTSFSPLCSSASFFFSVTVIEDIFAFQRHSCCFKTTVSAEKQGSSN